MSSPLPPTVRPVAWALEGAPAPEDVLRSFARDAAPVALVGAWAGGGALIASEPLAIASLTDDPFEVVERMPIVEGRRAGVVGGGWFGYLGYGVGSLVERLPPSPPRPVRIPAHHLAFYDHVLRFDRRTRSWWFEALWSAERADALLERLAVARSRLSSPPPPAGPASLAPFSWRPTREVHVAALARCLDYIRQGDIFQANLALRVESSLEGDPVELYARGVQNLHPPYSAYVAGAWGAVASLSPELFLRRSGRRVHTAPIKGTAARSGVLSVARRQRDELVASVKDRAENVMIVDLMRNDLGRVCLPGTVRVPALFRAETHPGIWHLVSDVVGKLEPGVGDGDLLRACFPPGSVTGAPKVRAMQIIAELESTGREAYTGSVGYASPLAGMELNVAIRTLEIAEGSVWLGAGGGIVADSDAEAEFRECLLKAGPIIEAVGGKLCEAEASVHPAIRAVVSCGLPRPDPALGVFETLLVRRGVPLELDAHLGRLARSVLTLYGASLPSALSVSVREVAARAPEPARLRVVATPDVTGVAVSMDVEPIDLRALAESARTGVELVPVPLAGGLGEHKWRDRDLLSSASGTIAAEPLLVDLDGTVLEAGRASVFAVAGGALVTPPADGRILPGCTRARVIALARGLGLQVLERPIRLDDLRGASEVLLTGSIRGVEPASGCRGVAQWSPGEVTDRLARALGDAWDG